MRARRRRSRQAGGLARAGSALVKFWPVIVALAGWAATWGSLRADVATLKHQVDMLVRYELWGQRPNVGPPPPLSQPEDR